MDERTEQLNESKAARDEAMGRVDNHANPAWLELMASLVAQVAKTNVEFTTDEVFDLYYALPNPPSTHEFRALGPVMLRAAKLGLCTKTNRVAPSRRRGLHASPIAIWKGCLS